MSNKHLLACRVSNETYNAVMELVNGNDAPYESTSEYLYTLIIADIARRKQGKPDMSNIILEALNNPEVKDKLRDLVRQ